MRTVEVVLVNAKGERKTVSVSANNIPVAARNATIRNPGWRFKSARFIGPLGNGRRSTEEVRSAILSGKHVSASELNAYARSPKGMMHLELMRRGGLD